MAAGGLFIVPLTLAHSVRPTQPKWWQVQENYYLWLFIGHDHDHHLHFIISRCREIYIHNSLLLVLCVDYYEPRASYKFANHEKRLAKTFMPRAVAVVECVVATNGGGEG